MPDTKQQPGFTSQALDLREFTSGRVSGTRGPRDYEVYSNGLRIAAYEPAISGWVFESPLFLPASAADDLGRLFNAVNDIEPQPEY